jgi:hypothetical protein
MKKRIFIAVSAILVLTALAFTLVSCNRGGGEEASNVSRVTTAFYVGENSNFAVTVDVGKREKIFIADGAATDVEDFREITVAPLKANTYDSLSFTLLAEGKSLEGTLSVNSYGEYTAVVSLDFVPSSVEVKFGTTVQLIELNDVLKNALTPDDVINIAQNEFKSLIEQETSDGELKREIYVKVITGDRVNYYYYVSFIGEGTDYWAMLIEPVSGAVISRRPA